jgi:hypothetical protein
MHTVILRDDDTNALTPVECLEKLYRPFLDRGLPVNLAVVPEVNTDARLPDGRREGFLPGGRGTGFMPTIPLVENVNLTTYLRNNPLYHVVQHGCHHDYFEFDNPDRAEVARRLDLGARRLREAGFPRVTTFVAPHDKLSRVAYEEVTRRYRVLSTGWFEWRRIPRSWWPRYLVKKFLRRPHWQIGRTQLLSHPGCLLSYTRPLETMLDSIKREIRKRRTTVLVTHWWEYFRNGHADEKFVNVLHETADYLASQPDICVTSFDDFARGKTKKRSVIVPVPTASAAIPAVLD